LAGAMRHEEQLWRQQGCTSLGPPVPMMHFQAVLSAYWLVDGSRNYKGGPNGFVALKPLPLAVEASL
jgi:hypothetical protein